MAIYLVDYENVKNLIGVKNLSNNDSVIIFYSQKANTLTFDTHKEILESKAKIEYKCVEVGGQNALDFQLSSYLGYLIKQNEDTDYKIYIIVTKDRGFSFVQSFWKKEKFIDIQIVANITDTLDIKDNNPPTAKDIGTQKNDKDIKSLLKQAEIKLSEDETNEIIAIVKKYKTKTTINDYLNKQLKDSTKAGAILKAIKPILDNKSKK